MASSHLLFSRPPLALAAWLATASAAWSQTTPPQQLDVVTVTGRVAPAPTIGGWGDVPLAELPLQATVIGAAQWRDLGANRLSDLITLDPAVSDAYNSEGYWDYLTVRGFVLDNRFNYRRDGLPISAETSIPLDNKARIEILKGTSGIQAGTSAPGGLVNYVVKRPTDAPLRSATLEWREPGSVTGAIDVGQRFGAGNAFGVRLNAAAAHLDPALRDAKGDRRLLALAGDWRLSGNTLIEAEFETSHRSQPSQPGLSMLGDLVPSPGNPRINLNNQPWSQPVVFDADTASLRLTQRLGGDWSVVAHAATQHLRTDDRLAYPFGCTDPDGSYYPDRFCPDGTFDLYDYRSDNERRRHDAVDVSLRGKLQTGPLAHALQTGVLYSKVRDRFERQAYNYTGTGNVDGTLVTSPDPTLTGENTNRDERSTELYLRDGIGLGPRTTAWLGVRHTRLDRDSALTDGTQPVSYSQSFTTPWFALSHAFAPGQLVYASWGRGIESEVVPNRERYTNAGVALPSLKSRQAEVGIKGASERFEWNVAAFDIVRPQFSDFGACDATATCTRQVDGHARHRGVEASGTYRDGPWSLAGGSQWLHARRENSVVATDNGLKPTNVPAFTAKAQLGYDIAALPGLNLQTRLLRESSRIVLPDNRARIPGYTRVDAALRYEQRAAGATWTWRAGVDNLLDKKAWRESPYQFSHVYLFPLAPRTLRVSLQIDL